LIFNLIFLDLNYSEKNGFIYDKNTLLCEKDLILPTLNIICLDISFDNFHYFFSTCDRDNLNFNESKFLFLKFFNIDYYNISPRGNLNKKLKKTF